MIALMNLCVGANVSECETRGMLTCHFYDSLDIAIYLLINNIS